MPGKNIVNVAIVGAGFMGKAHSNAYGKVNKFFDLPAKVVMHTLTNRTPAVGQAMADRWGWQHYQSDPLRAITDPRIDLVDVCVPNNQHAAIAIAAARAGKAIACEKPLAHNLADAKKMTAAVAKAGVPHFIWFNYRRVPAIALARQLIDQGRIGKIYHIRASYLQDWIMDPKFPLVWRLNKSVAGSGTLGDLMAHMIDLARYLVGEFESVCGMQETFIARRPVEGARSDRGLSGQAAGKKKARVDVDDATLFLARFDNGAIGTFESTRFAQGRKNRNQFEINGEKGSLAFSFERLNTLEYFDATGPRHVQGFTEILATEPVHPYAGAYWPPGHLLGYEHSFINQLADIVSCLAGRCDQRCHPDFNDGLACQRVIEAVERSSRTGRWVKLSAVK